MDKALDEVVYLTNNVEKQKLSIQPKSENVRKGEISDEVNRLGSQKGFPIKKTLPSACAPNSLETNAPIIDPPSFTLRVPKKSAASLAFEIPQISPELVNKNDAMMMSPDAILVLPPPPRPADESHLYESKLTLLEKSENEISKRMPNSFASISSGSTSSSEEMDASGFHNEMAVDQVLEVAQLERLLFPRTCARRWSYISSVRGSVITVWILCALMSLVMLLTLFLSKSSLRTSMFSDSLTVFQFTLCIALSAVGFLLFVMFLISHIFFWGERGKYYEHSLDMALEAAQNFQLYKGIALNHSFHRPKYIGRGWYKILALLEESILAAAEKVESLNELVEVAEAEQRHSEKQTLPSFNVFTQSQSGRIVGRGSAHGGEGNELVSQRRSELASQRRAESEAYFSAKPYGQHPLQGMDDLTDHDGGLLAGEIGPMVVYIVCKIFLSDVEEEMLKDEALRETNLPYLHQMGIVFNEALARIAASTGGVVVCVELDSAILTYNAFSPVPTVSALNTAYKAAIALDKELNMQKKNLTCEGRLNISWGMVLHHCRLFLDSGNSQYLKRPYVYSPELEFSFQVVDLCRLLNCSVLSLAPNVQSTKTIQIIPVDVIGVEASHTMFLYQLQSRPPEESRLLEEKMLDSLLSIHNHKFDEALKNLAETKDLNYNAKRLYYLASYLKKQVNENAAAVPNPYFRAGPSWDFIEMVAMAEKAAADHALLNSSQAIRNASNDFPLGSSLTGQGPDGTTESVNGPLKVTLQTSTVEKGFPNSQLPVVYPYSIERSDAFTDIEELDIPSSDDGFFNKEGGGGTSVRSSMAMQNSTMSCKIPSLQSSIVVGSSMRSHMVSARNAQRVVVVTGNEVNQPSNGETPSSVLKFILGDLIASGAEGREVYRGLHPKGHIVAIKKVPLTQHSIDLKTAERELDTLSKLNHLNILHYVANYHTDTDFYIIMEYISGGSLTDLIRNFGPLPTQAIRRYATDSLSGLDYLHRRGIVHRDISTNNIMMTIDGECKIADFGGAFLASESSLLSVPPKDGYSVRWSSNFSEMSCVSVESSAANPFGGMSQQIVEATHEKDHIFGTPIYMSPQAAKGVVDSKNDIWSFGIALCYCATGAIPFKEEDLLSSSKLFLDGLVSGAVRPVIPKGEFDEGLENMILMCLSEELEDRPSASDLLKHPYLLQGNAV